MNCKICDKTLTGQQMVYCGYDCRSKENPTNRARHSQCITCGVEISFPRLSFCSTRCEYTKRAQRLLKARRANKEPVQDRPCVVCNKDFTPRAWTARFCSEPCSRYEEYRLHCSRKGSPVKKTTRPVIRRCAMCRFGEASPHAESGFMCNRPGGTLRCKPYNDASGWEPKEPA